MIPADFQPTLVGPHVIVRPIAATDWHELFAVAADPESSGSRTPSTKANDGLGPAGLGTTSGATGRPGLRGRWSIPGPNGQVWQPYVRVNVWRDSGAEATGRAGDPAGVCGRRDCKAHRQLEPLRPGRLSVRRRRAQQRHPPRRRHGRRRHEIQLVEPFFDADALAMVAVGM